MIPCAAHRLVAFHKGPYADFVPDINKPVTNAIGPTTATTPCTRRTTSGTICPGCVWR